GQEMVGEVVEKQRARQIYESYKQTQKDPGLLEQTDFKTFEMRIFPIAAQAEQRVRITYYQELDFDHDWATYVYPLATDTRADLDSRTRGRFGLNLDVRSEVPITELESPSHGDDFVVVRHGEHVAQASLETAGGDLNRDLVLAYHLARPRTGIDLIASKPPGEDGYFLLTLTPGEELEGKVEGMDYAFLLDVSGSMGEDGKLALSRGSLDAFIDELGESDRFEVIVFNAGPEPLFRELRPAADAAKTAAQGFLGQQRARGGTFLEPALRGAYGYKSPDRPLNVVVLSDGMTDPVEKSVLLRLLGERPEGTRVFTIGIGNEVDRALLEQIAEDTGGLAAFLSRGDDFDRQAKAFRRKLQRPLATNLAIEIDGADVYDLEPQKLPNLFYGMPVRVYGRYRNAGPVKVHIRADVVGGQTLDKVVDQEIPEDDKATNPEIERMWAWHRVQRLLKEADRKGSRSGVVDEIVRLGEAYSIVTEYTSFLVLENDAEYQRWRIARRNAERIERDRREQGRLRAELDRLRGRAPEGVGPVEKQAKAEPAGNPLRGNPLTSNPSQPSNNRGDLDMGGAFDPLTAGLAAALAGAALASRRRRSRG
ncbi:MAG TPA: VIT and VWA domain-containing protein, partial [Thermoanaerobaculia bacterium]|nr:VIT and VWA domain-containing protein [Thermoanaerobaculia bacterium]